MGRWFPDYRTGTPEQCAEFRDAQFDLFRNGRYEEPLVRDKTLREETPRYLDLNERAGDAAEPLSRAQQWWHWNRALTAEDNDFARLRKASGRQGRDARKGRTR